ncbi:Sporulation related domain protein [Roseovarius albus]|uniref:Sporulation related domain protein n=1 Tax=Roseovarius albus TaxID=1247867 RepID=A0A1X6YCC9_9RHOB|nr:SPOR domain-containing protein [Roseovarius albus]SLN16761.1 Sporulation related domain protein [Roseovarius albus]
MASYQEIQSEVHDGRGGAVGKATNFLGAGMSLALIAGLGMWGYDLLVRDVSGVPVVRAAEGPMREAPEDPGGKPALNQGLAVNNVAAQGIAEGPAEQLILAPEPLELDLDDLQGETVAGASSEPEEIAKPAANQIELAVLQVTQDEKPEAKVIKAGLAKSLRPQLRPASLNTAKPVATEAPKLALDLDPANIPAGTRLAQLGAYESDAVARSEWERLSGKFGDYLEGKQRVVQKATSGGRVFYRLRAHGFSDLSDARRFCSALVSEGADCIPVVSR